MNRLSPFQVHFGAPPHICPLIYGFVTFYFIIVPPLLKFPYFIPSYSICYLTLLICVELDPKPGMKFDFLIDKNFFIYCRAFSTYVLLMVRFAYSITKGTEFINICEELRRFICFREEM